MFIPRFVFVALLWLSALWLVRPAQAQLQVGLELPRRTYIAYEPVNVTVTISNLAGRDITLQDQGGDRWFGFRIATGEDSVIGPRSADYQLAPMTIPAGRTVRRSVNLVTLFPITEFGDYRVQAMIFFAGQNRYFSSTEKSLQITEGRELWKQSLGVPVGQPGAGSTRMVTLLAFRKTKSDVLYARVADDDAGVILNTFPIGRLLNSGPPSIVIDGQNQVHVLQLVGPKLYLASTVSLDGRLAEQKVYTSPKYPPRLARSDAGDVVVKGGSVYVAPQQAAGTGPVPKLSDRPKNMPLD